MEVLETMLANDNEDEFANDVEHRTVPHNLLTTKGRAMERKKEDALWESMEDAEMLNLPILSTVAAANGWMASTTPTEWRDLLAKWANQHALPEEVRGAVKVIAKHKRVVLPFQKPGWTYAISSEVRALFEEEFIAHVSAAVEATN